MVSNLYSVHQYARSRSCLLRLYIYIYINIKKILLCQMMSILPMEMICSVVDLTHLDPSWTFVYSTIQLPCSFPAASQADSVRNQYEHFLSLWRSSCAMVADRSVGHGASVNETVLLQEAGHIWAHLGTVTPCYSLSAHISPIISHISPRSQGERTLKGRRSEDEWSEFRI